MKDGWEYKKLGELCDFQGGSQPPKNEWSKEPKTGYVRMLQIRDFTQNAADYIEYVKESKSLKYCNEDDILIGRYGASVGKILSGLSGAYNVAIIKTIPRDIVNKNYIKFYFLSPYFQHNLFIVSQHRAAQAGFSKDDIVDFQIPCPPLAEQERIVAELDLLNNIIEKKKSQLKEFDQLAQSIFYDMFGDPITNEKGWEVRKLGEVCLLKAGKAIRAAELKEKTDNTFPCYGGNGIRGYINKVSHKKDLPIIGRQGALCGNVNYAKAPFYATEHAVVVTPLIEMNIKWLYNELKLLQLEQYAHGVAQPGIAVSDLIPISFPLPPLPLQQEFAEKVEAIERQKALIQQSIDEVQTLFDSRMDYWFG